MGESKLLNSTDLALVHTYCKVIIKGGKVKSLSHKTDGTNDTTCHPATCSEYAGRAISKSHAPYIIRCTKGRAEIVALNANNKSVTWGKDGEMKMTFIDETGKPGMKISSKSNPDKDRKSTRLNSSHS